ncbi:MAPEG family protein [Thalassotalea sp. G2M2-11]|uniref:MAPEG family protein n=1 Tax=Thalassotalea sp. G2M2-11 TaxID=2787627 RepID=UPI0019D0122E|nr:MAPEG family protein [Thalassotalea sp. G2M2-11]
MTVLIYCLFIALLLPYLGKIPVAIAMHRLGGYDNNHPRAQQAKLTGFGARALAAHQNAFESLMIFAPAILLAIATHQTGQWVQQLALLHVGARVVYQILYLVNISVLRSLVWGIATVCSFLIVWQCL